MHTVALSRPTARQSLRIRCEAEPPRVPLGTKNAKLERIKALTKQAMAAHLSAGSRAIGSLREVGQAEVSTTLKLLQDVLAFLKEEAHAIAPPPAGDPAGISPGPQQEEKTP